MFRYLISGSFVLISLNHAATILRRDLSLTFINMPFYKISLRSVKDCSCKPASRGQTLNFCGVACCYILIFKYHLQKSWQDHKDSPLKSTGSSTRGQGVRGSSEMLKNYKELKVWQRSYQLCLEIYRITKGFPKEERYGLTSQIRRTAVSVPSNIAQGYGRKHSTPWILEPSASTNREKNHN